MGLLAEYHVKQARETANGQWCDGRIAPAPQKGMIFCVGGGYQRGDQLQGWMTPHPRNLFREAVKTFGMYGIMSNMTDPGF